MSAKLLVLITTRFSPLATGLILSALGLLLFSGCDFSPTATDDNFEENLAEPPVRTSPPIPRGEKPKALAAAFCSCQEDVLDAYGKKIRFLKGQIIDMTNDEAVRTKYKLVSDLNKSMLEELEHCQQNIQNHHYFGVVTADEELAEKFADQLSACLANLIKVYKPEIDKWATYMETLGGKQSEQLLRYQKQLEEMQRGAK